jgi:hypothetical protein
VDRRPLERDERRSQDELVGSRTRAVTVEGPKRNGVLEGLIRSAARAKGDAGLGDLGVLSAGAEGENRVGECRCVRIDDELEAPPSRFRGSSAVALRVPPIE